MSKKTLFVIVITVLVIFLLSLIGYYFIIGNSVSGNKTPISFRSFLPFSGSSTTANPSGNGSNNSNSQNSNASTSESGGNNPSNPNTATQNEFLKRLRKISSEPVSGAGTTDIKAGTLVRYIEKATGHIFEVEMFSPKITRISNTTIPLAYEATWGNKSNSLVARYIKDDGPEIDTYSLNLKTLATSSTENTISGIEFPINITSVSVYGNNIFYLVNMPDGSYGYVSSFDGTKKKQIWYSPFRDLTSQFVNDKTVVLSSKPFERLYGFAYKIDTTTGKVVRLLNKIPGLSALVSFDESKILYLNQDVDANLFVYDTTTKASDKIPNATFPEKCVWSKKNTKLVFCATPADPITENSLTNWYKGTISTNDVIWSYDFGQNTRQQLEDLSTDAKEQIDVINPILSDDDKYLIFTNKRDDSLWSLDLTAPKPKTID